MIKSHIKKATELKAKRGIFNGTEYLDPKIWIKSSWDQVSPQDTPFNV